MLRPAVIASFSSIAAVVLLVAPVAAAGPAPSPPPGSVSVQPAGLSSDGQGQPAAYHCGVAASAASSGYSAQPQQVSSSGASSPSGCSSSVSTGSAGAPGTAGQATAPGPVTANKTGSNANQRSTTSQTGGSDLLPNASARTGSGFFGSPLWIGLLLLLAPLLMLAGFALGRRRPARATA